MPRLHDLRRNATLTFAAPPLAFWSDQQYRAMPRLDAYSPGFPLPSLSIIIPARNEAANLLRLLPSLQRLHYPGALEIIVIDDDSSDLTGPIGRAYGARYCRSRACRPAGGARRTPATPGRALLPATGCFLSMLTSTFRRLVWHARSPRPKAAGWTG